MGHDTSLVDDLKHALTALNARCQLVEHLFHLDKLGAEDLTKLQKASQHAVDRLGALVVAGRPNTLLEPAADRIADGVGFASY